VAQSRHRIGNVMTANRVAIRQVKVVIDFEG